MQLALRFRALAAALAGIALGSCAGGPALPPAPTPTGALPITQIELGATRAKLGYCMSCHTADGGAPFAGGRPILTKFGIIYTTNITPDPTTGIGNYSRAAFARAMRRGVRRDGAHLYPAFPYDHFSSVDAADIDALYAFLMTRRPVRQETPPNRLIPPLGFRPLIGIWKALFFRPERFQPDPAQTTEWNRGAYLVQSLGHCGACHTPHNWLGAEQRKRPFDGGWWAEGWYAPPLNAKSPTRLPWSVERLEIYLRTGFDRDHAAAAGPMGVVAYEAARAPPADVRAMSVYIASLMATAGAAPPPDRAAQAAQAHPVGATLYAGACATCHDPGAPMMLQGRPVLQLGTPLHEDDPRDVIQIILQGLKPPTGPAGPTMPAFADSLTNNQVAELTAYLRSRFSDRPAWRNLPAAVAKARKETLS
jgi:mono/diheme cytochrome c family protein